VSSLEKRMFSHVLPLKKRTRKDSRVQLPLSVLSPGTAREVPQTFR
jgi:hypothetical protein